MNKFNALILLILPAFIMLGQAPKFSFSDVLEKESNETVRSIFEKDNQFLVVKRIEDNKTDFVFDVLDSAFHIVKSHSIKLPVTKIKKIGFVQNQLTVFGKVEDGNSDLLKMFAINELDGTFKEETLMTLPANGGYRTSYDVAISPNRKYFSLIGSHAYMEKRKEIINVAIYDSTKSIVFEDEMLTTIETSKRRHKVLVCNNNGFNYIIKKDRVKNKNNYYIYTVSGSGNQEHAPIRLKSRQIVDAEYVLNADGELLLAGFYSSPVSFNFEGLFISKFQEKATATFTKEYFLNANVVEAFKSKKEIKDYGYGLDYFSGSSLTFIDEKNMMLIAEHHSVNKNSKNGPEDYRKGFVLFNLDVNGGFKYSTPVITEQTDGKTVGYWSSPFLLNNEGKPVVYINRIGDGAKSAKSSEQENGGLPIESMVFSKSGAFQSSYPIFEMEMLQYCLNTNFKNKTKKSIICFESLDRKAYTFGILKPINE
jgi:hypothetical protein